MSWCQWKELLEGVGGDKVVPIVKQIGNVTNCVLNQIAGA